MDMLDKLSKEDRKHVEILHQLKRNEAFLATISEQLINKAMSSEESLKFQEMYIEKQEEVIKSIVKRLSI